jgi:hypothetical protein
VTMAGLMPANSFVRGSCGAIDARGRSPPPTSSRYAELCGCVFKQRLNVQGEILGAISVDDLRHGEAVAQAQTLQIARQRPRLEKDPGDIGTR